MDEVSKSEPVDSISESETARAAFVVPPTPGETITSELTRNTYTMGKKSVRVTLVLYSAALIFGTTISP